MLNSTNKTRCRSRMTDPSKTCLILTSDWGTEARHLIFLLLLCSSSTWSTV